MSGREIATYELESRELLDLSCTLYGEVEVVYEQLSSVHLNNPDEVKPLMSEVESIMEKIAVVDAKIAVQLQDINPLPEFLAKKVNTRKEFIKRLLKLNQSLVENAQRYKALIKNELVNMHKNRNAVNTNNVFI